jgi:hypothetical protein
MIGTDFDYYDNDPDVKALEDSETNIIFWSDRFHTRNFDTTSFLCAVKYRLIIPWQFIFRAEMNGADIQYACDTVAKLCVSSTCNRIQLKENGKCHDVLIQLTNTYNVWTVYWNSELESTWRISD